MKERMVAYECHDSALSSPDRPYGMDIPNSSPISKLHLDILWTIFAINADMDHDEDAFAVEALTTTRHSSQVCHDWRGLILESSSLWGKLIDLGLLDQQTTNWREVIMQRTGTSLLHIKGSMVHLTGAMKVFFLSVLKDHWQRIQKLDIGLYLDAKQARDSDLWAMFQRPAPNLRFFSVYLPLLSIQTQIQTFSEPSDSEHALFAHQAPVLQEITSLGLTFNPRTPWLANLRKLHMTSPFSIPRLLEALEHTPLLEDLKIWLGETEERQTLTRAKWPKPRHIAIPRLQAIALSGYSVEMPITFLEHISTAPGCSLSLEIGVDSVIEDPDVKGSASARRTIARYCRNYFQLHSPESLLLTIRHDFAFRCYDFSINLEGDGDISFSTYIISIFLDALKSFKFSNVTRLELTIERPISRVDISWLESSVKILDTTESTIGYLLATETEAETQGLCFPLLSTLEINELSFWNEGVSPAPDVFLEFFIKRKDAGSPIEILDLRRLTTHRSFDFRFLDEIAGLEILMTRDNREVRYVCGTGGESDVLVNKIWK